MPVILLYTEKQGYFSNFMMALEVTQAFKEFCERCLCEYEGVVCARMSFNIPVDLFGYAATSSQSLTVAERDTLRNYGWVQRSSFPVCDDNLWKYESISPLYLNLAADKSFTFDAFLNGNDSYLLTKPFRLSNVETWIGGDVCQA